MDRVLLYRLDAEGGALQRVPSGDAVLHPGSGPRHLAFHPMLPLVFVANELNSTVTTLRFDQDHAVLSVLASHSTLPSGWSKPSYAADIHVDTSGRFLYVSNRGHDSVAVFSIAPTTGALALAQLVHTGGNWPRNFTLDPTGRWLLVANERSGSIVVFGRDERSGRLSAGRRRLSLPSPVCLRFRAHVGVVT
jgi:6-phosphogluconolactonase